ncbi:hypothetical protein D1831_08700 [Lactiplantibacillus garii]|uniref:YdbS-like PH domain-containing protein n=1 Tax=Lactiplantibacillus garii TaxID=2306423 RepID=A0A426D6N2_9LACO|nr:PH domain-containing protein [Lactiplantibacillus garii]RRK10231.1 hypothetical protein D1831_08700 [Lactiplantibacillus garii]
MKPKHLAWPALIQFLWRTGRNLVLLWVLGFFLLDKLATETAVFWGLVGLGGLTLLSVVATGVRYWRFTYQVTPAGVTIQRGLFVRQVTHIPYAKIQTVQRNQWFYLRPLHLERLTIETAGKQDDDGEGQLAVVPQSVGDLIEAYRHGQVHPVAALAQSADTALSQNPSEPRYQISWSALNTYALSSLGVVPIILVLGWLYDKLTKLAPERTVDQLEHQLVTLQTGWLIGLGVLVLVCGLLASYATVVQRYYHFTLVKTAQTLNMTHGFFQSKRVSLPVRRIQAVKLKQSILRQWLRLTTVQALTAGQAGEDENDRELVLLPVIKPNQVDATLAPFISWWPPSTALIPVGRLGCWLFVRNSLLLWGFGLAALTGVVWWWLPNLLRIVMWCWPVGLLIATLQGRYAGRNAGVALAGAHLVLQTGSWFTRERFVVPRVRVQSLEVRQSVWLQRGQLAHLTVKLRAGNAAKTVEVRYLDRETIEKIQRWYLPA